MATKLWGQRVQVLETVHFDQMVLGTHQGTTLMGAYWRHLAEVKPVNVRTDDDGGTLKREKSN
jgi:hypothetical protein